MVQQQGKPKIAKRACITLAFCAALPAQACWDDAASRYQVSSALLYAIARTESGLDPQAIGRNRNGSHDIGLMQINSAWLPTLAAHGIDERALFEPCTNIQVGAWILAGKVARLGYTWDAVGAYNAANPALRRAYVDRVRRHLAGVNAPSATVRRRAQFAAPPTGGLPRALASLAQ
jgi:soluble lytic murein transglycosylase-like protein